MKVKIGEQEFELPEVLEGYEHTDEVCGECRRHIIIGDLCAYGCPEDTVPFLERANPREVRYLTIKLSEKPAKHGQ